MKEKLCSKCEDKYEKLGYKAYCPECLKKNVTNMTYLEQRNKEFEMYFQRGYNQPVGEPCVVGVNKKENIISTIKDIQSFHTDSINGLKEELVKKAKNKIKYYKKEGSSPILAVEIESHLKMNYLNGYNEAIEDIIKIIENI